MLGHRRRSRVLRENRESAEVFAGLSHRIEQFANAGEYAPEQIVDGALDLIQETSDALDALIAMGVVEEFTEEGDNRVVRYRIAAPLPASEEITA